MKRKISNTPTSNEQTEALAEVIKLGIDIHKNKYVVVGQVDQQAPRRPQCFSPQKFLIWVKKQRSLSLRVVSCYEAGCFGYGLHRKLEAMGIENLVVRPRSWDEYGKRIKTDKRDAGELCSNLDRYLSGNKKALCVVRVPTEQEERTRSLSRQRDTLAKERRRLQTIGMSSALYHNIELSANWWKPKVFEQLEQRLPEFFLEILRPYQMILVVVDQQLKEATVREERTANRLLPVGLGALSASILDREFVDYERFSNRDQVGSYTGLCPSEGSSGNKRIQGSINKHGNPRIRHILLEAVWRMLYCQPDYQPILYWKKRMLNEPFTAAKRKKMAVAIARQFAIDWWRIQTGRLVAQEVGLRLNYPTAYSTQVLRRENNRKASACQ